MSATAGDMLADHFARLELGDAALGRKGDLVAAAIARYRHVLELRPEVGEMMTAAGRGREVRAAGSSAP